jgi:hypothetical protein
MRAKESTKEEKEGLRVGWLCMSRVVGRLILRFAQNDKGTWVALVSGEEVAVVLGRRWSGLRRVPGDLAGR